MKTSARHFWLLDKLSFQVKPWDCLGSPNVDESPMRSFLQSGEYYHSHEAEPYPDPLIDHWWINNNNNMMISPQFRGLKSLEFNIPQFNKPPKNSTLELQGIDNLGYCPEIESPICDRRFDGLECSCCDVQENRDIICHHEYEGKPCSCYDTVASKSKEPELDPVPTKDRSDLGRSIRDTTSRLGNCVSVKTTEIWQSQTHKFASIRRRKSKAHPHKSGLRYQQEDLVQKPVIYSSVLKNYDIGFQDHPELNTDLLVTSDGIEVTI